MLDIYSPLATREKLCYHLAQFSFSRALLLKFPIVKPYLPNSDRYNSYLNDIFDRNWLTNNGPLVQLLERRLAEHLGVEHLLLVANGTLALQVAYAALNITGKVLTTPFSFAATASSLCWDNIEPRFIDIDNKSLNIDPHLVSEACTERSSALLGVHVFGNPCNVEAIDELANKHDFKVVYDAAHAFATQYKGKSILNYGDASTLSLHATKLFHSVEGGAIVFKRKADYEKAKQLINFGFDSNNYPEFIGINAKMSEFHAAMGLTVLDDIDYIIGQRQALANAYRDALEENIELQLWFEESANVGAYQPILLEDEEQLLFVTDYLAKKQIQVRRYFYPSLSTVPVYGMKGSTPIANEISKRVLCLPMYTDMTVDDVIDITTILKQALAQYN